MQFSTFFKSASIYVIFSTLNAAFPFLVLPLLTRYLQPSDYGYVANYNVLYNIIFPVIGISVSGAIVRFYFDTKNARDKAQLIRHGLLLIVLTFAITATCLAILSPLLMRFLQIPIFWMMICCFNVLTQVVIDIKLSIWRIKEEASKFGFLVVGNTILNLLLTILFVVVLHYSWQGRILGSAIGTFSIFLVVIANLIFFESRGIFSFDLKIARSLLKFGLPLIPHTLSYWILNSVDRVFITNYIGIDANGLYNVAFQVSMAVVIIQSSTNNAYVPWLYQKLKADTAADRKSIFTLNVLLFIFFIVLGIIALLCVPLFGWFVGSKFAQASSFISILIIAKSLEGIYYLHCGYFFYYKDNGFLSLITATVGCLHIVLCYVLIKNYGIYGACYATLLSSIIKGALVTGISHVKYKKSIIYDISLAFKQICT